MNFKSKKKNYRLYNQKLMYDTVRILVSKNIVVDDEMMTDKRTGEVLKLIILVIKINFKLIL